MKRGREYFDTGGKGPRVTSQEDSPKTTYASNECIRTGEDGRGAFWRGGICYDPW
jgi:hypothetical protein